jgi:O-antigen/teichoic acid export membrane protein
LSANTLAGQLGEARAAVMRRRNISGAIARTAAFNTVTAAAAALSGVIVARTVGPTVRGEYAAVMAWFGVLMLVGQMGQGAAVCYHVARDQRRARGYVATSRAMMMCTGALALACGLLLAPVLAHGSYLAGAYRIAFCGSVIAFTGTSYTYSLQARNTERWNLVRVSQPALALAAVVALRLTRHLTLDTAIGAVLLTMAIQLGYAYYWCLRSGLAPGRARPDLVAPLARYGLAQFAAVTPMTVNNYLDLLVLSQFVSQADLGRYAVAASVTMVPVPLVSAIGNVAFPRLAARRDTAADYRGMRLAAAASAGLAAAILLPIALSSYWLIPAVFGPAYRGAVPLVWILTPGGIFLASGQVVGDLLRGLNHPGLVAAAQGIAAVGTVVLLVALLPSTGVAAAAIASTVAYGTALAAMVRWLRQPPRVSHARHRRTRAVDQGSADDRPKGNPPPPRRSSSAACRGPDRAERTTMTIRELIRPLPGVRQMSLLRQRMAYTDSADFWEETYVQGGTSGNGSYGTLAEGKSGFLNELVRKHGVRSVIEFGCGDGNQLSLADYPRYIGLDVSRTAIELCQQRFRRDATKSFFLYDGKCFTDRAGVFGADLALSLDVVYHLTEDAVFEAHLRHLFAAGQRLVVVYSTDAEIAGTAPHVRHRHFTPWVEANCPQWRLARVAEGPNTERARADFFVYERP